MDENDINRVTGRYTGMQGSQILPAMAADKVSSRGVAGLLH